MQLVSATQFKMLNRGRDAKRAGLGISKQIIAPVEPLDQRALRFTISTDSVDRENDRIAITGWDLGQFRRNSVVLWAHDATRLPIGRAFDVSIEDGALKASVSFIPEDTPEGGQFAESVFRLARSGFISATSVGFRPIKWQYTTDKSRGADDWFPGIDFEEQELVELSLVTVPANPEALIEPAPFTASDTPPETGEELTSLDAEAIVARRTEVEAKQKQEQERARRRRVLQLAMATA